MHHLPDFTPFGVCIRFAFIAGKRQWASLRQLSGRPSPAVLPSAGGELTMPRPVRVRPPPWNHLRRSCVMPAPTISVVQPTRASAGQTVQLTGSNFTGATAVKFGNTNATFTVVNDVRINATVPAGSGTLLITVVNPSGTSNGEAFTYTGTPGARITAISPAATGPTAGGNVVTLVGSGFTGVTAVKFGNINATSYNVVASTVINNVVVPPGNPGTVLVTVVTAAGPGGGFAYDYVGVPSSTTTLIDAPDPSVVGEPVTFTATVAPVPPNMGTPTGTVTFNFGDGSPAVVAPLVGGVATTSHAYTTTAGSPFSASATYSGDVNFTGSSGAASHTVNAAATTTALTDVPDPSVVGQSVSFTATVSPVAPGAGTPTGTVTFNFGDGSPAVVAPLVAGVATTSHAYATTTGSPFTISASYGGSASFSGSAGLGSHAVNAAATTTALTDVPDPSAVGQSVNFTATVSPVAPGAGTPTGTVTFNFGDGSPAVAVPLSGGVATTSHAYATTTGSPFPISASYGGSANFTASATAPGLTHTVNQAATTTALTDVPDPSVVGQSVNFTATVSPAAPGAGTPTGSVIFDFGDGNTSAPVPLVGGVATTSHTYTTTAGSPFTLTATYGGDSNFTGSVGLGTHAVNQAATTTALTDVPDPSLVGEPVTFTATVSPVAPGAGTPTGTVVFDFGDGSPTVPVPLVGGVATTSHAYATTVGSPFTASAAYGGSANFTGSVGLGSHSVNAAATTTALTDVPDPSVVGQSVSFTATVSPVAPGAGTPTGMVTFNFGDGSPAVVVPLVGGVATTSHAYATTTGSPFPISASYGGSANFTASATGPGLTHTVNQAATTTVLTDVPDPSVVGQSVSFTATVSPVAPGAGTPTGMVTFNFGDGSPVVVVPLVGGVATTSHAYATTTGSPFPISASYGGSANFTASATGPGLTHTVNQAATTTVLTDVPDPSVVGQSVSFTATVSASAPGAGTPTGTVVFDFGDGSPTVPVPLVGGVATTSHAYTTTTGSPFALTATYGGDSNFTGSAGLGTHAVNQAATTTALTDLPDPSVVGEPVTFTATVSPLAPGAGSPTGTVTFDFGDGNTSAPVPLVGGVATTSHAYATTVGSPFALTASYSGDSNFTGSVGLGSHAVNQAATTTALTDLPDPSVVGEPVTFTATVSPVAPGAGTPTGSVTFNFGDGSPAVVVPLVAGVATTSHAYATTTGSPFTISASYGGDANFTGSATGPGLTHTVNVAATTTVLTDVPDPSVVGEPVTFTATVAPVVPGAGTPTGTVVFDFGDGSPTVPVPLVGGVATTSHAYTTTTGSPFALTATYGGDSNFTGSAGLGSHAVNQAATTTVLTDVPDPSVVGEPVTFTATVSASAPGAGTPTGTVVFDFGDGNMSAPVALVAGVATTSHAYATTTGSPFALTATYSGDSNFTGSVGLGSHAVNQAATTTVLTDVPDPSVVGELVTFTATVSASAPGAGTPTGSVTFNFGDGSPAVVVPLVAGVATTSHAYATTAGSPFALTATYGGDSNFTGSVGLGSHAVNQAATTTALADVPDPSVVGEPVTFTATVSASAPGAGTPTGTVVFDFGDGNMSAPVALVAGVATTSHAYATTTGSPFALSATYSGDASFTGSVGTGSHTVDPAETTTALADTPDPSVVGQSVSFTATVSASAPGAGTPTGTVIFDFGDGNMSAPVPLVSGVATTSHIYTATAGSPLALTASYSGDSNFNASVGLGSHAVDPAETTTALTDLPDPSLVGEPVTFTATVSPVAPGAGTPTGTVIFDFGDGNTSAPVPLVSGVATTSYPYPTTVGSPFTISAIYSGDANFTTSTTSPGLTHTVNVAATTTSVFDDLPDPSVVGEPVTFTAHVTPVAPGAGTPTGTVTFDFGDGSPTVPVALVGGVATTTHTYTTATGSPFTVTVTYGGDSNFTGSSGAGGHTVNAANTATVLTDLPDPSVVGVPVAFTATVSAVPPGVGIPTGTVTFDFGDGSPTVAVPLVLGVAATTHTYTTTVGSPFSLTATYGGSGSFTTSVGTGSHTVLL
ncbi:hypothetical protein G4Z16_25605 [Streptomyces bathyalis]|uniref:Bacterial Ig-like domain-containing protein n=1 Tax=Streptomyces bathyalis TaxID=2710756 RepID=A0A7T1WSJ3_9ACTN|nr:Ig-like domain repeat protein [Streptomyces bathyalis]QPP09233.1 hypothetical protein G4Z16_25605 [Streptomyces bathyalis]